MPVHLIGVQALTRSQKRDNRSVHARTVGERRRSDSCPLYALVYCPLRATGGHGHRSVTALPLICGKRTASVAFEQAEKSARALSRSPMGI